MRLLLEDIRRSKALSQRELARESGVGQDTISALEANRQKAQPKTVRKLAAAMGVSPEEMVSSGIGLPVGRKAAEKALPGGFVLTGRMGQERVCLGWAGGEFFGEERHVEHALFKAELLEGTLAGPSSRPIIFNGEKSLSDPLKAYLFVAHNVFDEVYRAEGEVPEIPPLRKGAIV